MSEWTTLVNPGTPIPAGVQALTGITNEMVRDAPCFERIADVPIYSTDSLVRRALSLQLTADARAPQASLPPQLWADLGLATGDKVRVSQGGADAVLSARLDKTLAPTVVRVPAGHVLTAALGASFGAISVAKA